MRARGYPASCFSAAHRFGVALLGVRHLFVTHYHQDLFPQHLVWRSGPHGMGPGKDFGAPIAEIETWLSQIGPRFSPLPGLAM